MKIRGKKITKQLKDGERTFKLRFSRLGKQKVKIRYNGDDRTESVSKTIKVKVKRR